MIFCYNCMTQLSNQNINKCPHCGKPLKSHPTATDILLPGTTLQGKFIVGELLGTGGFANTYIGWNQMLACRVAIKEFFPRSMSVRGGDRKTVSVSGETSREHYKLSLRSFLEEARRLAELNDVFGIPDIYSYFEENGTGYIVMEYLEGITVKKLMKDSGGRLNYEWSRQIILSVLMILKDIHRRGILHRDIAPDNIMITSDGVVELIDFGVAKRQMGHMADSVLMLKAGYSPLEQYTRNAAQGVYTDLYSVAASFYHMITGSKPPAAMERFNLETLKPLSSFGIQIPKQAEMAIMMCLYLNPEYRLASAEEFIMALDGENFKPVRERKQQNETDGAAKEKNGNREFPLLGKIASIVLLLAVVVMGVVLVIKQKEPEIAESSAIKQVVPSVIGMSEQEATELLASEQVNFVISEVIFDKEVQNGSEILEQQPAAGEQLTDEGSISAVVRSSEKCTYQDVCNAGYDVTTLAESLGIDQSKLAASLEVDAFDETKRFGDLYGIILTDGQVLTPDILETANENTVLDLSQIQSITYYISPYIHVKKLKNYVGKSINKLRLPIYTEENGKKINVGLVQPAYNAMYYSFEKEKGYIVKQNKKPGGIYDSRQDNGSIFQVVKKKIKFDKTDADGLIKRLEQEGFKVKVSGSGSEIVSVSVSGKGGNKYFTKTNTITVMRKRKAAAAAPKKGEKSTQKGGQEPASRSESQPQLEPKRSNPLSGDGVMN